MSDEETRDDQQDDELAGDGDSGETGTSAVGDSDKRIRDLQARADAEAARANKAEAALRAKKAAGEGAGDDPRYSAVLDQLREANLDAVYSEMNELREFGIDRNLVEGATRAEMRDSATQLVALIGQVATKVRNKVLAENGIEAAAVPSQSPKKVDYSTMSKEDFDALVKRSMR